jgi:superfamily II DNA/RNA helicase
MRDIQKSAGGCQVMYFDWLKLLFYHIKLLACDLWLYILGHMTWKFYWVDIFIYPSIKVILLKLYFCQVLLFSAAFNERVKDFVTKVIKDGNQIFVKKEELTLEKVKQYKVQIPDEMAKIELIRDKIFEFGQKVGQVIIFVRTRQSTRNVHNALTREDYVCSSIQGSLDQSEREKIIQEFKDGYTKVLISTDVLARGFDQAQVVFVWYLLYTA